MLNTAKKLLYSEFKKNYELVKSSKPHANFAKEKIHHSLQVLGAGNYIIKHEPWYALQTAEFIDLTKAAVLLHDISRFDEITKIFLKPQSLDHGLMGWEKLKQIPFFSDIRITLPVKHHGHIIEDFYADEEYKSIQDARLKEEVENIIFVIRDADKIANLHLIMNDLSYLTPIFVPYIDEVSSQERKISLQCVEGFHRHGTLVRNIAKTQADYMLYYICWLFDLNYKSSAEFCIKLKVVSRLFKQLQSYHDDQKLNDSLEAEMMSFLNHKFGV